MDAGTSSVQKERERVIRDNLSRISTKSDEEKIRILIRSLAANYLATEFNQISRAIFQGQLELLVKLNSLPSGLLDKSARDFYNELAKRTAPYYDGFSFEQFVEFFTKNNLAVRKGDFWFITPYGDEFLKHIVATHQTHDRKG